MVWVDVLATCTVLLDFAGLVLVGYNLRRQRRTNRQQAETQRLLVEREAAVAVREAAALEFREWGLRSPSHP